MGWSLGCRTTVGSVQVLRRCQPSRARRHSISGGSRGAGGVTGTSLSAQPRSKRMTNSQPTIRTWYLPRASTRGTQAEFGALLGRGCNRWASRGLGGAALGANRLGINGFATGRISSTPRPGVAFWHRDASGGVASSRRVVPVCFAAHCGVHFRRGSGESTREPPLPSSTPRGFQLSTEHGVQQIMANQNGPSADLKKILAGAQLPALPQSAVRLLELSQDPSNGPEDLAVPIESDPGLAGQVLRFVNSSYFGFSREISSVKLASRWWVSGRSRTSCSGARYSV